MQKFLHIGYISRRNDGMSELRINGFIQVRDILFHLLPYIRFKRNQAQALYKAACLLSEKPMRQLTKSDLRNLVSLIVIIQNNNYITKHKKNRKELLSVLDLTP